MLTSRCSVLVPVLCKEIDPRIYYHPVNINVVFTVMSLNGNNEAGLTGLDQGFS